MPNATGVREEFLLTPVNEKRAALHIAAIVKLMPCLQAGLGSNNNLIGDIGRAITRQKLNTVDAGIKTEDARQAKKIGQATTEQPSRTPGKVILFERPEGKAPKASFG